MQSKSVGTPLIRVDGRAKVSGKAMYAADKDLARICHAVIVPSTISKGTITQMDASAAEKVNGVLAILTHKNAPKLPEKPGASDANRPSARKLQLLQNNVVLYANQPIAVAVAETIEGARDAAESIRVQYAKQAHAVDLERRVIASI